MRPGYEIHIIVQKTFDGLYTPIIDRIQEIQTQVAPVEGCFENSLVYLHRNPLYRLQVTGSTQYRREAHEQGSKLYKSHYIKLETRCSINQHYGFDWLTIIYYTLNYQNASWWLFGSSGFPLSWEILKEPVILVPSDRSKSIQVSIYGTVVEAKERYFGLTHIVSEERFLSFTKPSIVKKNVILSK
jgi:hypothetical protein